MPEAIEQPGVNEYADLQDDELMGLHGSVAILLAHAEPLLADGRLPAGDWGMPVEMLAHLHNQTGTELAGRGLANLVRLVR